MHWASFMLGVVASYGVALLGLLLVICLPSLRDRVVAWLDEWPGGESSLP